jgi:hypothetical protein
MRSVKQFNQNELSNMEGKYVIMKVSNNGSSLYLTENGWTRNLSETQSFSSVDSVMKLFGKVRRFGMQVRQVSNLMLFDELQRLEAVRMSENGRA